ncbi:MAG: magnesium transporter [Clostridia bacterium]|nr:magnesium transporter [Clostridia bacterium]MBR5382235.1 magnesium transporter [Clostridia bacterium]
MSQISSTLETTVTKLWEEKKYNTLRDVLSTMQPASAAELLAVMPENAPAPLFRLMPKELAAETFVEMEPDMQEKLIRSFSDTELKGVLDELYMDDAVDLVEEMPANVVKRILAQADPEMRKSINELLQYPEDSAGSIMTTEFVALRPHMTAAEALTSIRRTGMDKETVNTCYVIGKDRKLMGAVTLRTIVMAQDDDTMESLMTANVISVSTQEDQETVAHMFSLYDLNVLPVVDKENRMVGIVTVDDAIDVMEEEVTEDISKMAAITPSDKPYLKTSVFTLYKSRIPWLLLLMLSATFTGMIITHFEATLSFSIALTAAIPMLMDTGGNCGSQSSVTVIRALSLGELHFTDLVKVWWKEVRVALMCGVTLATANFIKLILIERVPPLIALTICLTLLAAVMIAKFVGCTLPILADKLGFDPAVMASPFITTIVDALSLLIFCTFAGMLLTGAVA